MFQQWSNLLNLIIWDTKNTNGSFTRIAIDFYKHNTKQKLKTSMYFFPVYNRMVMKVDESWRLLSLYPKAWFRGSQFFNFSCILWGRIWQNSVYPEFFFFFFLPSLRMNCQDLLTSSTCIFFSCLSFMYFSCLLFQLQKVVVAVISPPSGCISFHHLVPVSDLPLLMFMFVTSSFFEVKYCLHWIWFSHGSFIALTGS